MNKILLGALAASTALVPMISYAQDANPTPTADECRDLLVLIEGNELGDSGMSSDQALLIVERDDPQTCLDASRMARGEISNNEADANYDVDASARLQVVVPDPEVTVDQAAPQVNVEQADPQVQVTQPRPVVTVNQQQPQVRVQMTPPTITISMPQPEIIVEMPDPEVAVSMQPPRVTVQQADPTVTVEQGDVSIEVGDERVAAEDDGGSTANVTVDQEEANVQVDRADAANISIEQVQPEVRFNSAEPNVQVEGSSEPQVRFEQAGDPKVTFRQMNETETRDAAERAAATNQTDEQVSADQADDQASADPATDRPMGVMGTTADPEAEVNRQAYSAETLMDVEVVGADGDEIGEIEDIVMRGGQTYVIVGNGGFFGIGEKEVALPLSDMVLRGDQLVMRAITEDDVEQMEDVDVSDFQTVEGNQTVDVTID
ncbi:PRC-barrel domain-containing protein [Devosia sp.]|uniref:PRC-barrel domain-containing protein n=1 Tax=Devosia sp. TaxID=1871048 RepID=UPI003A91518B